MAKFITFDINAHIMTITAKNGRIYLPKEVRERYGERFRMIECKDRIILLPVSKDPLKKLRSEWKDVEKSVKELKEEALKEGVEEAGR